MPFFAVSGATKPLPEFGTPPTRRRADLATDLCDSLLSLVPPAAPQHERWGERYAVLDRTP